MSLTSFLDEKEIRSRFKSEFDKPLVSTKVELLAPPLSQSYGITGTAFDYLFRFMMKKIYPNTIDRTWVAENSLNYLKVIGMNEIVPIATKIIQETKICYRDYLKNSKNILPTTNLIQLTVKLAYLDTLARCGQIDVHAMRHTKSAIVKDLEQLLGIVDIQAFKPASVCILNPTFGKGSNLVGGADADLLIDDCLIDIKVTKHHSFERDTFNQVVGYYCLSLIGGIDDCRKNHKIKRLGIYFARHASLFSFQVTQLDIRREFLEWIKKRAVSFN